MDTIKQLKSEFEEEYQTTKKFFDRYPEGKNEYAPHEKSMKLMPLATHIAEVFGWPSVILNTDTLDFAEGERPAPFTGREDLLKQLDKNHKNAQEALGKIEEQNLEPSWSIAYKGNKLKEWSKYGAIRHALNQVTHHRAQLGTYYRQLDIPLPGSYGPSADDAKFG